MGVVEVIPVHGAAGIPVPAAVVGDLAVGAADADKKCGVPSIKKAAFSAH